LGFDLKDRVQGSPLRRNMHEVREILTDPFGEHSIRIRQDNLLGLLDRTTHTVPYYRDLKGSRLDGFPIIKKTTIQENFDSFKSLDFETESLFRVSTSGSTGVPFFLYHNTLKRKRNTSDVLYFMGQTGYRIGNALLELEVWRGHNRRSRLRNLLQNTYQFDVTKLDDDKIKSFLKKVGDTPGQINMLGFSSAFESICQYMDKHDIFYEKDNVAGITANSEYLNGYTRETLRKRFCTQVYSRYSNEEIGILAHQTEESGDNFVLNWGSYYFEILDMKTDAPAEKGELGRIVVTDLFNYSMPIIRYDTGDVGMFAPEYPDNRFLSAVEGRKMDLVTDTRGTVLSSFVVYTLFYPYYHLLNQYQFIQEGAKEYTIKLNAKEGFNEERELIKAVKNHFGQDAGVRIQYVDEIPALASGKRRKVVNKYIRSS
jgi:phenylacetate-CoA ligase